MDAGAFAGEAIAQFAGHSNGKPIVSGHRGAQASQFVRQAVGMLPEGKRNRASAAVAMRCFEVGAANIQAENARLHRVVVRISHRAFRRASVYN